MKICLACNQRFEAEGWACPHCGQAPPQHNGYPLLAPTLTQGDDDAEYRHAELFQAEANHFWFRARNRLIIWALQTYFPKAYSFLEVGCGTGFVLAGLQQEFPALSLSASDILTGGLVYAAQRLPDVSLFQMDARHIPFEEEFDIIGAFDVLEHIADDEWTLAQLFQGVKRGGGLILSVPQHPFLWSYLDEFSHHKRRYTRSDLVDKVRRAGFELVRITSFVSLLLPLLWLSRLKQRHPQDNFDVMTEFRINPLLNLSLEKVLALERFLIHAGLSFPAGGSLLLIAKRPSR